MTKSNTLESLREPTSTKHENVFVKKNMDFVFKAHTQDTPDMLLIKIEQKS
mgnify:CR=1 FL=1